MLSFFPLDVLDEIWDLIESVSEGFLTYSLGWNRHSVLSPTYRRAIKEVSKVLPLIGLTTKYAVCRKIFML